MGRPNPQVVSLAIPMDTDLTEATTPKKPLQIDAVLAVDRTRWFVAFLIMALIAAGALAAAFVANERYGVMPSPRSLV